MPQMRLTFSLWRRTSMKQRWIWTVVPVFFASLLLSSSCGDNGSASSPQVRSGSTPGSGSAAGTGGSTSGIASAGSLSASGMSAGNMTGSNMSGSGTSGSPGSGTDAGGASGAATASGGDGGGSGIASSGAALQPDGGPAGANSVLQRGNHASRDATWVQPKVPKAGPPPRTRKPDAGSVG